MKTKTYHSAYTNQSVTLPVIEDSYEVQLSIEEIENEGNRLAAREDLAKLEVLYKELSEINAPIEFGLDAEDIVYLQVNDIVFYSVTKGYQMEIGKHKSVVNTQTAVNVISGLFEAVDVAA